MSSIEGSGDGIAGDIAYRCGGVTPDVVAGAVRSLVGATLGMVTIGLGGSSCGLTVRVETALCVGSLAQSFQLLATFR
jgi:hypothetical protein